MRNLVFVALGGALGAVCRYLISRLSDTSFPWGTLAVNLLGSFLIGLLVGVVNRGLLSPEMKLLLVTGFCGGFTTFSTFASEAFTMLRMGDAMLMALYVGMSVALGIAAVCVGLMLSR
ncbi:MAG: fluoride efflux transporter CrcB [Prevotellaceae bacterium]|nr:fluoride efflux transporter CrcB [Prevotellaceae bacterium]